MQMYHFHMYLRVRAATSLSQLAGDSFSDSFNSNMRLLGVCVCVFERICVCTVRACGCANISISQATRHALSTIIWNTILDRLHFLFVAFAIDAAVAAVYAINAQCEYCLVLVALHIASTLKHISCAYLLYCKSDKDFL